MEWEIMSTPDLVNLTNHLSCVIDESPKMKITKILHHQLQQINTSRQNQNPPRFCYYYKETEYWKGDCDKLF